ncbi:MAG: GTPase Era [Thermodesulfobacteriota bacterium]
MEPIPDAHSSGFVAIAGRPNVGKSTLVNTLLGTELSIVTPKPQTTRHRITAILSRPRFQIVLVDTPGIHETDAPLNRAMVDAATRSMGESDGILMVTTPGEEIDPSDRIIVDLIRTARSPAVLAINKVDLVRPETLLPVIDNFSKLHDFRAIVPVSALKGAGLQDLLETVATMLPPGPPLFPEEDVSDLPERFFVSEMVREQIMRLTGEEIPYKSAVVVERFDERPGRVLIQADIHVERQSQKKIVVGKGGAMIKRIGTAARMKIEAFLGCKVHLELFVKVSPRWTKDAKKLNEFGYRL